MNNRYAVMGNPVEHSLSPIIHQLFAKQTGFTLSYEKILIDLSGFEQQIAQFFIQGGKGLNVTLPCKERAFSLADHVTPRCDKAKAANTLWRSEDGLLHADNTDGVGLIRDLAHYIDIPGKRVLILGAGGASRGILAPLLETNPAQLTLANRTPEKAHALCKHYLPAISCDFSALIEPYDLVINATSASLSDQCPALPAAIIMPTTVCYDLAYQLNGITPFVAWATSHGCNAVDGLGMLIEQAAEAFAIWHGVMPNVAPVMTYFSRAR